MAKKKKKNKDIKKKSHSTLLQSNLDNFVLLESRQVFLYEDIDGNSSKKICKQLITLDSIDSKKPILLNINSSGGNVTDGFAIIDVMRTTKSPIITLVTGIAASMAGIISVAGYKRLITHNSFWMGHEIRCGSYDYLDKIIERTKFYEKLWNQTIEHLKKFTKLTLSDFEKLRRAELWLDAEECKKKGIADYIV